MWLFHYNAAGEAPWKFVLDQWFARYQEGRGAVFSTVPIASLIAPIGRRKSSLPRFFKFALRSLRALPLRPVRPGAYTCLDEVRAEPFWTSHRITVRDRVRADHWRFDLQLNRVQDLVHPIRGETYSNESIRRYVNAAFEVDAGYITFKEGRDLMGFPIRTHVHVDRFVSQWNSFITDARAEVDLLVSGDATGPMAIYSDASRVHASAKTRGRRARGVMKAGSFELLVKFEVGEDEIKL